MASKLKQAVENCEGFGMVWDLKALKNINFVIFKNTSRSNIIDDFYLIIWINDIE